MKAVRLAFLLAAALLAVASPANAAKKQLWYDDTYNSIARTISGVGDLEVLLEDDVNEWYALGEGPNTLGFVCLYVSPDDWCYHRVYISPDMSTALGLQTHAYWWEMLGDNPAPSDDTVYALITFVHESYHWRLYSSDEARVEACAIRDLPHWLETQFRVPRTVQQTQTVPQVITKRVKEVVYVNKRVKRNGKWVWAWVKRYRWKTVQETVYVEQVVTVPNPVFTGVVNTANAIHAAERPPYSGGVCA